MRKILFILLLTVMVIGCATTNTKIDSASNSKNVNDTIRIVNDSLEYEILIIEPGFNNWLVTQPPRGFYGQQYLETRNKITVTNFNNRVLQPSIYDPNLYIQQINYDNFTDYGYEVNYLLFNWFEFFQERYNQKLR
ncbi:DUF6146 family protein [Dokdonia sp. Hel_I_53]|uniref:DUF6146 family protein n=1 Tax=Dokdonia sp. Hel_I_53 TaxID=1566287 RepID=UPI00119C30C5|nr:DUF6146 family protein [Dokdonia sp. Hel_I_53]TVZ51053.1 hypothetical protein OD90_0189 [Dokdonia sp. Hel_I_53]